jgi:hypothetical protein
MEVQIKIFKTYDKFKLHSIDRNSHRIVTITIAFTS